MGLNIESVIELNSARFERGIDHAKDKASEFAKEFIMGAIGVGTVSLAIEKTVETAKNLVNEAKRLNMTVEQVQLLKQAAKDSGKEFDAVAASIEKINVARAKALGGDKKTMVAFQALGVSQQDLRTKSGGDLFTQNIGDKVKGTNVEEIAAPLREVLGRGAGEAVAILKTDFGELGDKMRSMGAIMDTETAAKLQAMADEFEMVSQVVIAKLAPALLKLAEMAYMIALKGAGKVAKYSAGAGSVYEQTGGLGGFSKFILATDWNALKQKMGFAGKDQSVINAKYGVNAGEVAKAEGDAEEPWKKGVEELQAALDKAAADLKAPKPDFSKTEDTAKKMSEGKAKQPRETDALVKTGNFLGASRGVINNAQSALAQHAAKTAENTKQVADNTKIIAEGINAMNQVLGALGAGRIGGGSGSTIWGSN